MVNELKKLFLAGIGTAAVTYEKASKLIDEMVEKGKLTVEEGKELTEEIKKSIKSKKNEYMPLTKDDLDELGLVTKDDLYELKERLNRIEDTLYNKNDED